MTVNMSKPETADEWLPFSAALTRFVNHLDLGKDLVVYCFDTREDNWEQMPAAWHRPATGDIVVNLGVIFRNSQAKIEKFYKTWPDLYETTMSSDGPILVPAMKSVESYFAPYFAKGLLVTESTAERLDAITDWRRKSASVRALLYGIDCTAREDYFAYVAAAVAGVLIHETGHSIFSTYILDEWWSKTATAYQRSIITMFEELRCEYQQTLRLHKNLLLESDPGMEVPVTILRKSADLIVNLDQARKDLEAARDADGGVSISAIAMNATLVLGRSVYFVFDGDDIQEYSDLIESLVGTDRFEKMFSIWDRFMTMKTADPTAMLGLADEWAEMFPNDSKFESSIASVVVVDGSGESIGDSGSDDGPEDDSETDDSESGKTGDGETASDDNDEKDRHGGFDKIGSVSQEEVDASIEDGSYEVEKVTLPGIVDELTKKAAESTGERKRTYKKCLSSAASYSKAKTKSSKVTTVSVDSEDYSIAKRFSNALQAIYLTGRDRFHVGTELPPGRLRVRAAVQTAADKRVGNKSKRDLWTRTKTTVDVNPRLTVGVMTDCSGSQGWAETFSSRMSWVIQRAFGEVNGRTASVAFGSNVYILSRPGERATDKRSFKEADEGAEDFDKGLGTLDQMLNLTDRNGGVRMLFVFTDGMFVIDGEMERRNDWLRKLKDAGCTVVWVNAETYSGSYHDPDTSEFPNVHVVALGDGDIRRSVPREAVEKVIKEVQDALQKEKSKNATR